MVHLSSYLNPTCTMEVYMSPFPLPLLPQDRKPRPCLVRGPYLPTRLYHHPLSLGLGCGNSSLMVQDDRQSWAQTPSSSIAQDWGSSEGWSPGASAGEAFLNMPYLLRDGSEGSRWYLTGTLLGTSHTSVKAKRQTVMSFQEKNWEM